MSWSQATRSQLQAKYPQTHSALANLVTAMDYSACNMGKRSWYGVDKSKSAYHKIGSALRDTVLALHAEDLVTNSTPAEHVLEKLQSMLGLFQQAYPNWQSAYIFAQAFFEEEPELTLAVVNFVRGQ